MKRPPAAKKYRSTLDELYAEALAADTAPKAKL